MASSWTNNALAAGVVVALIASISGSYFSYQATKAVEATKTALEKVVRFESNTKDVIESARDFIAAVNENKDLSSVRSKLVSTLATQVLDSSTLRPKERSRLDQAVKDYQLALADLKRLTDSVRSPVDMPKWIEAFSKVLELKAEVARTLQSA
ncbi:3-hydroxyisobutyrate dehydrogenase-like beta-hydroxyacid dehydrogenase [Bosea sp. OAE752]|uniref:hypothetical protein n=1 Tax=Bosea sp. OAE752 TaxID=2663873 RepID=UPI003D21020C